LQIVAIQIYAFVLTAFPVANWNVNTIAFLAGEISTLLILLSIYPSPLKMTDFIVRDTAFTNTMAV